MLRLFQFGSTTNAQSRAWRDDQLDLFILFTRYSGRGLVFPESWVPTSSNSTLVLPSSASFITGRVPGFFLLLFIHLQLHRAGAAIECRSRYHFLVPLRVAVIHTNRYLWSVLVNDRHHGLAIDGWFKLLFPVHGWPCQETAIRLSNCTNQESLIESSRVSGLTSRSEIAYTKNHPLSILTSHLYCKHYWSFKIDESATSISSRLPKR